MFATSSPTKSASTSRNSRQTMSATSSSKISGAVVIPRPTSENPYKEEHYRRIAYANTFFASDVPGWKTDRGRFYIMWGLPESVDTKPGIAPPTETWHYRFIDGLGQNVVRTFKDDCVCGKYQLSEADSIPGSQESLILSGSDGIPISLVNQIFLPHLHKLRQPILPILRNPPRILPRHQRVIHALVHQQFAHALDLVIRRDISLRSAAASSIPNSGASNPLRSVSTMFTP